MYRTISWEVAIIKVTTVGMVKSIWTPKIPQLLRIDEGNMRPLNQLWLHFFYQLVDLSLPNLFKKILGEMFVCYMKEQITQSDV